MGRSTRSNTDLPDFSVSSPVPSPDTAALHCRSNSGSNSGSGRQPAPRPAKVAAPYLGRRKAVRSSARPSVRRCPYDPDAEASRPQLAGAAGNVDMELNEDESSVPAELTSAAPKVKRSRKKVGGTGGKNDKKKKQRTAKQKDDFDDEPITAKVCPESPTVQLSMLN